MQKLRKYGIIFKSFLAAWRVKARKIVYENIKAEEFSSLRDRSGMRPRDVKKAQIALENTLYMVGIRADNNSLVAFGRVVGDGATSFIVDDYLKTVASESAYICLIAEIPANKLYEKFGFEYLNENEAVGMYRPYK